MTSGGREVDLGEGGGGGGGGELSIYKLVYNSEFLTGEVEYC